jgi:hypothetical protein
MTTARYTFQHRAAAHEAGHALAYALMGGRIRRVVLGADGHGLFRGLWPQAVGDSDYARACLAGPAVEALR